MSIIQLRLVTKLRNDIYKHIQMLPLRYFNKRKYGDITSVIINDVGTFNKSIGTTFHKIIVEPINIVFFTISVNSFLSILCNMFYNLIF